MSTKSIGDKIVSVKAKKKEVAVSFESGLKLSFSPDDFTDFYLYEGKEVSYGELKQLSERVKQSSCYAYALSLLRKENYTYRELKDKLLGRGASEEEAGKILKRLQDAGRIDDALYAKTYAEDVASLRLYGKNKVLFKLRSKGVPESVLSKLEFPVDKEMDKAVAYAETLNRRKAKQPYSKKLGDAISSLRQRGFDSEVAYQAAKQAITASSEQEQKLQLDKAYDEAKAKYSRKYEGFELRSKVFAYLLRKGYDYDEVVMKMEEKS